MNLVDELEFEIVYEKYSQMLFNIIYSYLKNYEDSENILQDVFMTYLLKNPNIKNEEIKFWLIRVAINKSINELKNSYRKKVILNEEYINIVPSSNNVEQNMFDEVCALPHKYKDVIVLYYYNNLSTKEISKILKITESGVRMRLLRAKQILKDKMR